MESQKNERGSAESPRDFVFAFGFQASVNPTVNNISSVINYKQFSMRNWLNYYFLISILIIKNVIFKSIELGLEFQFSGKNDTSRI